MAPRRLLLTVLALAGCGGGDPTPASPPEPVHPIRPLALDVLGAPVAGWTAGPEGAPAVLLLHGARFDSSTWRDLGTAEAIGARARVVAVDLPGFGASAPRPEPTDGASRPDEAAWLAALLDALDLERVLLVAPSMAGCHALPFALAHPGRLLGLVAVAPACAQGVRGPCGVPALVLWGTEDRVFPLAELPEGCPFPDASDRAQALAAAFSSARVELFQGASHPCYLDDPARFHALVSSFLDELAP